MTFPFVPKTNKKLNTENVTYPSEEDGGTSGGGHDSHASDDHGTDCSTVGVSDRKSLTRRGKEAARPTPY